MLIKPRKNKKGFTLIELIVVVAVLAILAAVAVPSYLGMVAVAGRGVDVANASAIVGAVNVYNAMGNPIADTATVDATVVQPVVDAGLWPSGFGDASSAESVRALARIAIQGGIAIVTNTDTTK